MQGIVVRPTVEVGQNVAAGDLVMILEAMKMEKFITAEVDGEVAEVLVNAGDSVNAGQLLVRLNLAEEVAN
jgi:biotin carboxyl carrier protein